MKIKDWLASVLIVFITFLVFSNVLNNSFAFDDGNKIVNNPFIKDFRWIGHLFTADYCKYFAEDYYRPVTTFSYFLNYAYAGLNVHEWHILNVFIHTFNAVLVYLLARFLLSNITLALFSALIFAVHPIQCETINELSIRHELLLGFFNLLSLLFYSNFKKHRRYDNVARGFSLANLYLVLSLISFISAIFCDGLALTLPFVILGYEYVVRKSAVRNPQSADNKQKCNVIYFYLGIVAVYLVCGFFTGYWQTVLGGINWGKIVYVPVLFVKYGWLLIFPWNMRVEYNSPEIVNHYLYLPLAGVAVLVSFVVARFSSGKKTWMCKTVYIVVILIFMIFTFIRNKDWQNEFQLWTRVLKYTPNSVKAHARLGHYYYYRTWDKSMDEYKKALSFYVKNTDKDTYFTRLGSEIYNNIGLIYYQKGDYNKAMMLAKSSLILNPNYADAYLNLGMNYLILGDMLLAKDCWNKGVNLLPGKVMSLVNHAHYLYYKDYAKCKVLAEHLALFPQSGAELYILLAQTYLAQNDPKTALLYINKVNNPYTVPIINEFPQLLSLYYVDKGREYFKNNQYDLAIGSYQEAIYTNIRFVSAYQELGKVYYIKKMYNEAVNMFEKVWQINPQNGNAAESAGIIYLAQNRPEQSIDWFNKSIKIRPSAKNYLGLAKAYYLKNEKRNARMCLNKVVQLDVSEQYKKDVKELSELLKK